MTAGTKARRWRHPFGFLTLLVVASLAITVSGCGSSPKDEEESVHRVDVTVIEDDPAPTPTELTVIIDDADPEAEQAAGGNVLASDSFPLTSWSEDVAPEYYRIVDYSQIPAQSSSLPAPSTASYSPLDHLGRSGQAVACVTYEMMEAGRARERRSLSGISPSGWGHNAEVDIELYDGTTYHGQFWNRSHLIAKSLGGADVVENLVCGTRMQNVGSNRGGGTSGGMAYCENLARMWLELNRDGWITYVATPVYAGDELVCRSVFVDMRSSDGELDLRVEVFNAAKGYEVDYASGTFAPASTN